MRNKDAFLADYAAILSDRGVVEKDGPSDLQIVDAYLEAFGGSREQAINRLSMFDPRDANE